MATGRRRGRAIFYIAFILILLLVLAVVVFKDMIFPSPKPQQAANNPAAPIATPTPENIEVVYAVQNIKRGQELTTDLIKPVAVPRDECKDGNCFLKKDMNELLRSRAKSDVSAGMRLTSSMIFAAGNTSSIASFEIPTGKVAISVPISKLSSVAYGLQKGDHVNVIVSLLLVDIDTNFQSKLPNRTGSVIAPGPISENQTYVTSQVMGPPGYDTGGSGLTYLGRIEIDPTMNNPVYLLPSEPQRPRLVSQTLIQDAVILQMGAFSLNVAETQSVAAAAAPAPQQTGQPAPTKAPAAKATEAAPAAIPAPDVVTLVVSPQDAITLNYLMLAGANLNMVLRSAGDPEQPATEAVTLQFILDQYQIPNPAKLPYGVSTRMDAFPEKILPFPEVATAVPAAPAP